MGDNHALKGRLKTAKKQVRPLLYYCLGSVYSYVGSINTVIIFTVRTHGPYAVTKCYLSCANHTVRWHTFDQLLWQHCGHNK